MRQAIMTGLKEGTLQLADRDSDGFQSLIFFLSDIRHGKWLGVLLLAAQAAFVISAGAPPLFSSGGNAPGPPALLALPIVTMPMVQQSPGTGQKGTNEGPGPVESGPGLDAIQSAIGGVQTLDLQALGRALGYDSSQMGHQEFDSSSIGMEAIDGLGSIGAPVVVVKWMPAGQSQNASAGVSPMLYLLSWDGNGWQASYLAAAAGALTLQVLPESGGAAPLFAVVVYRGMTAVPYPVIFQFQNHHATLVWDGRSEQTSYSGYNYGSIQFEKTGGGNVPVMIATGRADPGLLVFPSSPTESRRGFQAATAYVWKNDAYVPLRTEYTHNRDYVLYSFIAALHLHDFKAAYSLIDAAQFLKTKKPSLDLFRARIQNAWPEFIQDRIFHVPARADNGPDGHTFTLRLRDGEINEYHPTFTPGPDYRLTGLERTESQE
jgi:hypothetical protein